MVLSTVLSNQSQNDNCIGSDKQRTTTYNNRKILLLVVKPEHSNLNADITRSEVEDSYGFCVHIDFVFMGFIGILS